MDWIQMTVRTTTEGAEAVSAMFMGMGIQGAVIEDKERMEMLPEGMRQVLPDAKAAPSLTE